MVSFCLALKIINGKNRVHWSYGQWFEYTLSQTFPYNDSAALCNSRRRNHEVWSHLEEGPGHCSISKTFLSVQMSIFYI